MNHLLPISTRETLKTILDDADIAGSEDKDSTVDNIFKADNFIG